VKRGGEEWRRLEGRGRVKEVARASLVGPVGSHEQESCGSELDESESGRRASSSSTTRYLLLLLLLLRHSLDPSHTPSSNPHRPPSPDSQSPYSSSRTRRGGDQRPLRQTDNAGGHVRTRRKRRECMAGQSGANLGVSSARFSIL